MKKEIENTIPVLSVSNMEQSVDFYLHSLGFKVDWGNPEQDAICSISRDGHCIMLSLDAEISAPSCIWIGLETDLLISECMTKNIEILQNPTNNPWAYDMKIEDIDGNVLWLGAEPLDES